MKNIQGDWPMGFVLVGHNNGEQGASAGYVIYGWKQRCDVLQEQQVDSQAQIF